MDYCSYGKNLFSVVPFKLEVGVYLFRLQKASPKNYFGAGEINSEREKEDPTALEEEIAFFPHYEIYCRINFHGV